jgi:hypothetical protein
MAQKMSLAKEVRKIFIIDFSRLLIKLPLTHKWDVEFFLFNNVFISISLILETII